MKALFLKAKHWQLFLVLFGLPLVIEVTMMSNLLLNIDNGENISSQPSMSYMAWFPIMMILFMGGFFGWLWSIAMGLKDKIPANVNMAPRKFKVFFFYPLCYLMFLMLFMAGLFNGLTASGFKLGNWFIFIIIPMHLFGMFCMFYTMYYIAKTLKTVELQREVKFGEFIGEFFLLWFYIIGLWIIQPKVNRLVQAKQ